MPAGGRVLAVIPAPTFGGAANQVLRLREPLGAAGWEQLAVLPTEPGNAATRLRDGGVEVLQTPMHRLRATADPRSHLALLRHTAPETAALRRLVRAHGIAVVQNHGDLNPQAGIAGHLEGAAVHWQLLDSRTPPPLRRLTMPLVCRLADSISTVGRALAASHPGVLGLGERCVVLYPPVVGGLFIDARERRQAARAELGISEDALCVGAIGNRNPQKGHEWLLRAAAIARRTCPEIVVRILGAPSPGHETYDARLRAEARRLGLTGDDGSFAIADPGTRVAELIGAFDVFCLASVPNSEGMPTVIIEAMAAGIPVVATDVGAVAEVVLDGTTGRVVAPLDAGALAAALVELAGEPERRAAYGAAGRERALSRFSLDRLVGLYVRAFEAAVAHRAGRRRHAALTAAPR